MKYLHMYDLSAADYENALPHGAAAMEILEAGGLRSG
jgi:hypothetical protein